MAVIQQQKTTSTKAIDKWKRKKWYTLLAPAAFDQINLGETPASKPNLVEGRTLDVTLDKLTNDRKQRHIKLTFQVKRVQGLNANTATVGHEISGSYVGRMVRRRKSKIDVVATVETRDGKTARVTGVCLCGVQAPRKIETEIRKLMTEELQQAAKRKDFEQFVQDLIFGNLAAKVFKKAKNLAIIKRIDIIKSHVLVDKSTPEGNTEMLAHTSPASASEKLEEKNIHASEEQARNTGV